MKGLLFLFGSVRFSLPEGEAAPFFEYCRARNISVKALERDKKNGVIRFSCTCYAARRLRGDAVKHFSLSETERSGVPVLLRRLYARPGMLAGVLFAVLLLAAARLVVWDIEIEGAESIPREELMEELALCGVTRGSFLPALDTDDLSMALRQGDRRVAYATLNRQGTVLRLQIREAEPEPAAPLDTPANLVASCDGVVTLPLVFEGECLVKPGDVVRAGQILAGGLIDTDNNGCRVTRAAGQVLARTIHTYTVHIPFAYEEKVYTGKKGREISLLFFGVKQKIFKNTGKMQQDCDIIETIKWADFGNGKALPFGIAQKVSAVYELRPARRGESEARRLAEEALAAELARDGAGRTLLERTVRTVVGEDGVTMTCTAVCEEDIALTQEFTLYDHDAGNPRNGQAEERTGMYQEIINTDSSDTTALLFGVCDAHAREIETAFGVDIRNRSEGAGDAILITGESEENVRLAAEVLKRLREEAGGREELSEQQVAYIVGMVRDGESDALNELDNSVVCLTSRGKPVTARTLGQKKYVDAIAHNTVVFGIGPAGTGKTFLAVAAAVKALRAGDVSRIILTRPAIEAGEKLGFLPGDLQSKIDPYLRPLYDALYEMMGAENYARLVEKQIIEVAPLAYMRGRTLDDAFIILDEAQNATPEQMKMFLTRLGTRSHAVVTGDLTQTDLPGGQQSGLSLAVKILDGIPDIHIHAFTDRDVVRHRLVQRIIQAYDRYEREQKRPHAPRRNERTSK